MRCDTLRIASTRSACSTLSVFRLPGYHAIDTREDMAAAVDALGLPVVIKTRRLGYDGKGQFVIRKHDDLDEAWKKLGGNALIAEQWVEF